MKPKFMVGDRVMVARNVNGKYHKDSNCWYGNVYTIHDCGSRDTGGTWYQFYDLTSWAWEEELELVGLKQEDMELTYTNQIAQDLAKLK